MRFLQPTLFTALTLLAGTGPALASSASLNGFTPRVLPVLVQVNARGKVTDASPAMKLSPRLARLLRENLDEMISQPAVDRHGRPVSSQFVINLALQAASRAEGAYDARFAYVSASPVPAGSWYWVHIDGHRLALANQHSFDGPGRVPLRRDRHQPDRDRAYRAASLPPLRDAVHDARDRQPAQGAEHGR
ncbi:MAG: hypothetical protein WBA65_02805 [Rhodanobacter sp.]|jgi:hypothetical protein